MQKTTSCLLVLCAPLLVISEARGLDEATAFPPAARLLQARCALPGCHAGPDPAQSMRLRADSIYRSVVNVPARSDRRRLLVVPGAPERSLLYIKLLSPREGRYRGGQMPLAMDPLTDDEIAVVRQWIESFPVDRWGEASAAEITTPPLRTFHDSYLANLPTTDALGAGTLEFRILHRFKPSARDAGGEGLYGLDGGAWISFGLAYGLTERFEAALRRTNLQQDYEVSVKGALIRQRSRAAPFSLSLVASVASAREESRANRARWGGQAIVARRFNDVVSAMLVPTYVTRTNHQDATDTTGTAAIGVGVEMRISPTMAVTGEWITQTAGVKARYEGGSVGLSFATSRHVFHLLVTNISGTHVDLYAPGGDLEASDGHFRLGFNISRIYGGH